MRILLLILFALYLVDWIRTASTSFSKEKYDEYASKAIVQYEEIKTKTKNAKRLLSSSWIILNIAYIIIAIYIGNEYRYLWFMILVLIQIVQWIYSIFVGSLYIDAIDNGTVKDRYPYKRYMAFISLARVAYYVGGLYLLIRG